MMIDINVYGWITLTLTWLGTALQLMDNKFNRKWSTYISLIIMNALIWMAVI